MTIKEFAGAKVNLCLHVTGQRADGYHLLDSVVMFADLGDHLHISLRPGRDVSLQISGPMAQGVPEGPQNLVVRAAQSMGLGCHLRLEKHLPAAAGIGGGSADAAATLRGLARASGQPLPPDQGLALGADVPVCLQPRAARMQGIGEVVTALPLPALHTVLVNPRVGVPTAAVFQGLAQKTNPALPDEIPAFAKAQALCAWLAQQRNDLEAPALQVQPVIGQVLAALRDQPGLWLARMSGSGATCVGVFSGADTAAGAAKALQAAQPHWWVAACQLS
ncbi:MAG: 4-(cytidine 5'-diphospho)-2-C-methyl-D-erythritol kinase [Lutimaribacter sp.]